MKGDFERILSPNSLIGFGFGNTGCVSIDEATGLFLDVHQSTQLIRERFLIPFIISPELSVLLGIPRCYSLITVYEDGGLNFPGS